MNSGAMSMCNAHTAMYIWDAAGAMHKCNAYSNEHVHVQCVSAMHMCNAVSIAAVQCSSWNATTRIPCAWVSLNMHDSHANEFVQVVGNGFARQK